MEGQRLEELQLPQMVQKNEDAKCTAFTVSTDYRHGTTTGISAADRAATIRGGAVLPAMPIRARIRLFAAESHHASVTRAAPRSPAPPRTPQQVSDVRVEPWH